MVDGRVLSVLGLCSGVGAVLMAISLARPALAESPHDTDPGGLLRFETGEDGRTRFVGLSAVTVAAGGLRGWPCESECAVSLTLAVRVEALGVSFHLWRVLGQMDDDGAFIVPAGAGRLSVVAGGTAFYPQLASPIVGKFDAEERTLVLKGRFRVPGHGLQTLEVVGHVDTLPPVAALDLSATRLTCSGPSTWISVSGERSRSPDGDDLLYYYFRWLPKPQSARILMTRSSRSEVSAGLPPGVFEVEHWVRSEAGSSRRVRQSVSVVDDEAPTWAGPPCLTSRVLQEGWIVDHCDVSPRAFVRESVNTFQIEMEDASGNTRSVELPRCIE